MMAGVKWKEPLFTSIPVISLVVFMLMLPSCSQSQWISWRNGRHSELWHPNMPASPRTLRHSQSSSSSSNRGSSSNNNNGNSRPIDHRSLSHSNFYTINSPKDQLAMPSNNQQNGAYHYRQQQGQARYSSADFGRRESPSSSGGKNVRISDIPIRASPSSPTTSASYQQQRSMSHQGRERERDQIPSNSFQHRHNGQQQMNGHNHGHQQKNKVNWQSQSNSKNSRTGMDSTRRPVSQQAGHLLDSWPNTNTHHHLAPVPSTVASFKQMQNGNGNKNGFSNMKPEKWGNNVLVSNKPIELKAKVGKANNNKQDDKKASDRQLIIPGYPKKDKAAVANTINTLTKLSPKKPIFVFMRKEGIMAVKAGADAGDVIKKLAGTSKLPFYNGTNALPSHSMPTVFLAPEDMGPPNGYGKIPIPNLKPKNATPRPTYTKILMPGGTHMKGSLMTTTTSTTPAPSTAASSTATPFQLASASSAGGFEQLFQNNSINNMSLEQKLQLLQLLRSQPNHPLADKAALAILASASPSTLAPSPASPVPSAISPGFGQIFQGPTIALPTAAQPNAQWPQQLFPGFGGQFPGLLGSPSSPFPSFAPSSTPTPLPGVSSSVSPSPSGVPGTVSGSEQDIHKLIGTIVESAVSNTVSSMLQHQNILQQQSQPHPSIIGVGPPLHAHNMPGGPSRGPPHLHFGRGPPPQMRPRFPPFQQRPHFPPSPAPGRFPPHPSAGPPPQPYPPHPSAGAPQFQGFPPTQPNPSAFPPSPTPVPQQASPSPSPQPSAGPPQNPTASPSPFTFQQQPQQQLQFQPQQQQQQQPLQPSPFPPQQQQQPLQQPPFQPQQQQQQPPQPFPFQQQQQHQQHPNYQFHPQRQGPIQHPFVPQFQAPSGYPSSTPNPSTASPGPGYNPSSTASPPQFPQQFQQFPPHPNGIRQPPNGKPPNMRMVERPFNGNKPRNPIQNALQFFGISTPRPDMGKSQSPSPTPALMSSTPYPPRHPSPTPFGRPGPHQQFHSSTPGPLNRPPPSPFPYQQQQQQQAGQFQQQNNPGYPQNQGQQQQGSNQVQVGLQPGDGKGKKPTLIVQTPNGATGKKNTYVITGGGQELPELTKIMKVLNDLHVDSDNTPSAQSPSPSSTTQQPTVYSPSPTPTPHQFTASRGPTSFSLRPTISPNVMIKNSNVGITPSPSQATGASVSSTQQYVSSTTPAPLNPSSVRPHVMSSTQLPLSGVSPVMRIINAIQQQIPGIQVSPSVETVAENYHRQQHQQQSARPIIMSTQRPLVSPTPSPSGHVLISSARPPISASMSPSSAGPFMFSSPRPVASPSPTPSPGQVIISSTGFPRVINVSPSGSDTPQSIHQAVVEAIMKQQAAEAGGGGGTASPGQIVVTGGGRLPSAGPTPQYIEVIPAGGAIPGLGGNSNAKPFVVQLQSQQQQQQQYHRQQQSPSPSPSPESNHNAPFDLNDPNLQIHQGTLESHETYTEKSRKHSSSSVSVESAERPRPVYSRERYQEKTHHHSKEVSDEFPEKNERRPLLKYSKEQYDYDGPEHLNPNRRMYSGENSKQDLLSEEAASRNKNLQTEQEKLIEKIITEDKIVWKQGPGQGELIPTKVRTQERVILRPSSKEGGASGDSQFSQRRTPLSSAEHFAKMAASQQKGSVEQVMDKSSSSASLSKEIGSPSNFAGILRSKMKFDKLMEKLYPSKQLVSPFTITNNSANFVHPGHNVRLSSGEIVPTIASSLITTPHQQQFMSSISPTLASLIGSSMGGLISPSPTPEQGRFRIRPGQISNQEGQQKNIMVGVSPSGQPYIIQSSPSSSAMEETRPVPSIMPTSAQQPSPSSPSAPSSSSTVEQRLIFIPQGTAATAPVKPNNPQILITTVDELPDLMAQLSGQNPEIRMVPDRATLEAELAKVAASSTASASTFTKANSGPPAPVTNASPSTAPPTKPAEAQNSPTPTSSGIRRMDEGAEKAFTWRPAINATMASILASTPYDNSRRLVSGLGAGMLHAMSAGFGNIGNGLLNKYPWLGPSAMPPQQPQPTQQIVYQMQNGIPVQKLPINGPYQQVLMQQGQDPGKNGAQLGYYGYKWANMLPDLIPTAPPTMPTSPTDPSTKSPDYKLMYRSQFREEELPIPSEKLQPVSPVHKLKKGAKVKTKSRTTASPIDPVSAEEYEDDDDDDVEQEDLIPHDSLVPKHAGRGKLRQSSRDDQEESSEDDESAEDNNSPRRRQDTRRNKSGNRRRRPGKLTEEDEEEDEELSRKRQRSKVKSARPTKHTYDEEDDASPSPKQRAKPQQKNTRGRSDPETSDEEDEDDDDAYDMYDVKPAFNLKRKKTKADMLAAPTSASLPVTTSTATSTTAKSSKNKAIYVNREMFLVSGEERTKEGYPKAEPVYQPNQPIAKFSILQGPSIISGQSVVKKSGPGSSGSAASGEQPTKPTTTLEPKTTAASPTTTTTKITTSMTTSKATTKLPSTKATPTMASKVGGKKDSEPEDYTDAQHELRNLLKKIQDRLQAQDEVYDFGEDAALYDYYDEMQQVLSTKATTTTTTTKGTPKPKKSRNKKGGKKTKKNKNKKNKKKNKKNKKGKNKQTPQKSKVNAVTKPIPTRRPVTTTTTEKVTSPAYVHHHQRHPVSSLEQFTSFEEKTRSPATTETTTTTTTTTTSTTTLPPPPAQSQSVEEVASLEGAAVASSQSGSLEQASNVAYVFSETAKDRPKLKRRPLWVRRRVGSVGALASGEGLQPLRMPNGPNGKVIRLVRRRRPMGARRRMMQQRQLQYQQQQQQQLQQQQQIQNSFEQPAPVQAPIMPLSSPSTTTAASTSTSTHGSIEVAPPNYSSPPLEQYFEQNSLERRVGNSPDSIEGANGTASLKSPKRKLKLIRLKGQRAQWRLRLHGSGEESSSERGGPRPAPLIAPREVSAPLPLQAPLPSPVFTSKTAGLHNHQPSSSFNSPRAAKSASDMIKHYTTSFSSESSSSSVEAKVCIRGKCEVVSRQ